MSIETRLYAIVREIVGFEFEAYYDVAAKIHGLGPEEFSYTRLGVAHVVQPESILPYISLLHFIGAIRKDEDETYKCVIPRGYTERGLANAIDNLAIKKMEECGFTRRRYLEAVRKMLSHATLILPSVREVYQALAVNMTEAQFSLLCSMSGIRRQFQFVVATRRVMIPAGDSN